MIRREWVMSHESWVRWGMLCRNFFWNDKPRVWLIWYPANLRYASVLAWVGCRCSSIQCGLCASVSSKKKSVNIIWASDSVRTCDMWHVWDVKWDDERLQLEFDSTTQMLSVLGDDVSFPIMIQRWSLSWLQSRSLILFLVVVWSDVFLVKIGMQR